MVRGGWSLFALTLACHDSTLHLSPPWAADRTAVVVEGPAAGPPRQVVAVPPSTPLVLDVVPGLTALSAFTYPSDLPADEDLVSCGIELGNANPLPISPLEAFRAVPVDLSAGEAPLFSVVGLDEPRPALSYRRCIGDPYDCRFLPLPEIAYGIDDDHDAKRLAVLSDRLLYYSTQTSTVYAPGQFGLVRYEWSAQGGEHRRIPPVGGLSYRIMSLTFDGVRALGTTFDRRSFSVDADGTLVEGPPMPPGHNRIAAGPGLVVHYGGGGLQAAVGTLPALTVPVSDVVIISPSRVVATAGDGLMFYDGTSWRVEHRAELLENWALGGDAEVLVAVQGDGRVLLRDEGRRIWEEQGTPFGAQVDLKAVTGLGRGRYVAVGQDGLIGVMRSNGRPCMVDTIAPNNFQALTLAPGGRRLYGVLDHNAGQPGDPPAVAWLDLPAE
jgi:hypothetical protein